MTEKFHIFIETPKKFNLFRNFTYFYINSKCWKSAALLYYLHTACVHQCFHSIVEVGRNKKLLRCLQVNILL